MDGLEQIGFAKNVRWLVSKWAIKDDDEQLAAVLTVQFDSHRSFIFTFDPEYDNQPL